MNKKEYTCIIIDDEELARKLLIKFLSAFPYIKIIGEASNGIDGFKLIQEKTVDLVFLDIQMPGITGIELAGLLSEKISIVFTTAYDQYALKAFETNAIDYLLKPFSKERLELALNKAIQKSDLINSSLKTKEFASSIKSGSLERVVVKNGSSIKIIPIEEIIYIEASDDYVEIHTSEGKFLKSERMKFFEENLPENQFARIHRSIIVQIDVIKKLELSGNGVYTLTTKNGLNIPVSRSGYALLKEKLNL